MEKKKKDLLTVFLFLYIVIEAFLIVMAIIYFYTSAMPSGPESAEQIRIAKRNVLLYPVIFGIFAPIIFYLFWKWKYRSDKR